MQEDEHAELKRLLEENITLTKENNKILKKLYRHSYIGMIIRIIWYCILIGLPFALYFYFLEPYFSALGSDYQVFIEGMKELPGFKNLDALIP